MCTTVVVGKKATKNGATLIARNCDAEIVIEPVKFIVVPENDVTEGVYHSYLTHFKENYPKKSLRYQMVPYIQYKKEGIFGESGINSKNVAMSATESIFSNTQVLAIDPLTDGLGEDSLVSVVLPYISSAREGVTYLGKLIEEYGSHEGNGVIFSDKDEIWYMEIPCGHHWIAQRVPDDCCAVIANQSIIEEVDFNDPENFMYSEGLREFVDTYHLNPDYEGFNFRHIFGTSSKEDREYNTPRVWYGQNYLGHKVEDPRSSDMPFVFKPNRKLSYEDVGAVLSSHYDETIYDPFNSSDDASRKLFRPISMNRTSQSHILEIRNDVPEEIAAITWINSGPTAFNPYVPFYANSHDTAPSYNHTTMTYDIDQAYWMHRTLAVLVERDYDVLKTVNFDYLSAARQLANHMILETDRAYKAMQSGDVTDFLTKQNKQNIEEMNHLTMTHIGELVKKGLGLSKLTFDITKDV